jgi:hypothetical protein
MEIAMLHSLQPKHFVPSQHLQSLCKCPECKSRFLCGHGVISLTYYRVGDTEDVKQGLAFFCSTTCLLLWEQPEMLGLMH